MDDRYAELECLFDDCSKCPAWNGTTCSGELEVANAAEIQRSIPDGDDQGCIL